MVSGGESSCIGKSLLTSCNLNKYQGKILEVIIEKNVKNVKEGILNCRAIAFWNPSNNCYHWYLSNLLVAAAVIYPLYRLRWQIELIFKACKNSLNANAITSANKNIIESLLLTSIAAYLSSQTIKNIALNALSPEEGLAISFQRIIYVFSILKTGFINCILNPIQQNIESLIQRIYFMKDELYDPNYRERETSKARIYRLLMDMEEELPV